MLAACVQMRFAGTRVLLGCLPANFGLPGEVLVNFCKKKKEGALTFCLTPFLSGVF